MNDKPTRRGPWPTIAAAVALVAVAGVAGVYVTGWGAGNGEVGQCAASADLAASLKPLIRGEVAAVIAADEPADVSGLAFKTTDGKAMTLADFSGRTVLLNLWATWCAPCREEMPALDRLQASRGGDDFQVVTVNVDVGDPAKPAAFLEEAGIKALPDYRDDRMKIFNDLKSQGLAFGMPTTLIVDPKGCQIAALHGPAAWDGPEALALIDAAAGGS